jgi:HAD superfamily hydrolase (TIGR01548 family)
VRTAPSPDLLATVDTVIFDIDGVLLDISASIRTVNLLILPAYLRALPGWTAPDDLVTSADIERFKEAGGFNDDWDLTCAAVLLYLYKARRYGFTDAAGLHALTPTIAEFTAEVAARGGWLRSAEAAVFERLDCADAAAVRAGFDRPRVRRLFQELWAGDLCPRLYGFEPADYPGPGWIRQDRPLLDVSVLPTDRRLACLTGRTLSEARVALELTGMADRLPLPGPHGITSDLGYYKPEPWGMRTLLHDLDSRVALYIGDTLDDLRTVQAFRALPEAEHVTVLSAQVLTGTVGPGAADLFTAADWVASDVNAILAALPPYVDSRR